MKNNRQKNLLIVLPAYNEEQALASSLNRLEDFCHNALGDYNWSVLIANNGSTDRTAEVAYSLSKTMARVSAININHRGRGGALRVAASIENLDYLLYMDVDLSTELKAVTALIAALDHGADIAIGSRLLEQSKVTRRLHREVLSRGYNWLLHTFLKVKFKDAQCGFKAFRVKRVRPVLDLVKDQRWFFDTELLVLAEQQGLRIKEIPVHWTEDTNSHVNIPQVIAQDLAGMVRLKFTTRGPMAYYPV